MIIKAFDDDLVEGDVLKAFRKLKRILSGNRKGTNSRTRVLSWNELKEIRKCAKEQLKRT